MASSSFNSSFSSQSSPDRTDGSWLWNAFYDDSDDDAVESIGLMPLNLSDRLPKLSETPCREEIEGPPARFFQDLSKDSPLKISSDRLKEMDELFINLKMFIDQNPSLESYRNITKSDLYLLFIDGDRWEKSKVEKSGPFVFDVGARAEPGYMRAMVTAFIWLSQHEGRLTSEAIQQLHDLAVGQVEGCDGYKGYRNTTNGNGFSVKWGETLTEAGKKELIEKWKKPARVSEYAIEFPDRYADNGFRSVNLFNKLLLNPEHTLVTERTEGPQVLTYQEAAIDGIVATSVDCLLAVYYSQIDGAGSEDEKLTVIARLVQNLDQIHPFYDGNIRSFAILLINHLLKENDLLPTCLEDPNCVDCLSEAEIVEKIKEGQARFLSLIAG